MIGVLLVSHGEMAEGIKDSVGMIVGDAKQFDTLPLIPGQDIATLSSDILLKIKALNSGKGVIVFVDLFGASPYNAAMSCLPNSTELDIPIRILTGMNLPMIITAICNREFSSLEELAHESLRAGVDNIKDAIMTLQTTTILSSDQDDY